MIEDGVITSDPSRLADAMRQAATMEPASGADPDQDYALASRLIARFNGQIIKADDPPETEPGVVY